MHWKSDSLSFVMIMSQRQFKNRQGSYINTKSIFMNFLLLKTVQKKNVFKLIMAIT